MKKVMSVFVLLMFVGSLIVMTGCFGGDDDGIAAVIGTAFVIAIVASSGGGGAAVFAANPRDSLRPAINLASDTFLIVTPLDDKGVAVGEGTKVTTGITFNSTNNTFNYSHTVNTNAYTQYRVDFYNSNVKILEAIKYVAPAQMTGVASLTVNATSTAEVKLFNAWTAPASRKSFNDFSYNIKNLRTTHVEPVAAQIFTTLTGWATLVTSRGTPNYDNAITNAGVNPATIGNTLAYNVSGYIKQIDGAGSSSSWVQLYQGSTFIGSADSVSGYYTITGVPNGDYNLTVGGHHTFTPTNYSITVKDADVTGKDFQAIASMNVR